jgi:hypothetical protein
MGKRKRGHPIGGKHPAVLREYWRELQRQHREAKKDLNIAKKG